MNPTPVKLSFKRKNVFRVVFPERSGGTGRGPNPKTPCNVLPRFISCYLKQFIENQSESCASLFLSLSTNKDNCFINKWGDVTNCNYQQLNPRQLHTNCPPWASAWVTRRSSTPKSSRVCITQDSIFSKGMRKILESEAFMWSLL